MSTTARKFLIFAAAAALGGEVVLMLWAAAAFYGFVAFGDGVHFGAAGPAVLEIAVLVLNIGLAAVFGLGAVILTLAGFGAVLNKPMQAVMIGVAAIQLFVTIVVTGVTGWTQFVVLGGVFVLVAAALAVSAVSGGPSRPEPGPVEPAPGPQAKPGYARFQKSV